MLEIRERADQSDGSLELTLPFEERQRSRARVRLSSGEEVALLLPRGSLLRGGDALTLSDGRALRVVAAQETVSTVYSADAQALARAAYHLGNRHIPLEVGRGYVRYAHDHVLDGMVRELGLSVVAEQAPFEPEGGAYGRHSHSHGHSHSHSHSHGVVAGALGLSGLGDVGPHSPVRGGGRGEDHGGRGEHAQDHLHADREVHAHGHYDEHAHAHDDEHVHARDDEHVHVHEHGHDDEHVLVNVPDDAHAQAGFGDLDRGRQR
jgi:urease accessory protein